MECSSGSCSGEELKAIRKLAIRGSEIVRQLMIYAGKDLEVYTDIDVSRIVDEMLALLTVSVSKHAALETNLANELPPVRGSAAQVRQLVMNLVTNASEALADRDGLIRVTTCRAIVETEMVMSEGVQAGEYVELEVSDNGCGMTRETQARVFDPFFTTKSSGRGLGLSVVDGIVRNFGGVVQISSTPSRGTTVRILLPCASDGSENSPDSIPRPEDSTDRPMQGTVLVVDDEDPLRRAVVKMLRKTGFEVLEATNGAAAIELLRVKGTQIDIILLDMTMPGPSNHEVLAEAAKVRQDLKVILTSAYSQEIAAAITAPQIRGFLRKPFRLDELVQTLRNELQAPIATHAARNNKHHS